MIGRREFITLLGGAAAWPVAARAQQSERMRRIGVLMNLAADDRRSTGPHCGIRPAELQRLGWIDGRNVQIDTRWGAGDADRIRRHAAELAALAPDVIVASGSRSRGGVAAGDPHRADRVRQCRRPGRRRLCREPGTAGRQRHRFYAVRIQHERKMAGAAQGDRAGVTREWQSFGMPPSPPEAGSWPLSSRRALAWGGAEPGRHARCRRDRARHRRLRARAQMAD